MTSDTLERELGLSSGWIEARTGIRERRYADAETATSDLALAAVEQLDPDAPSGWRASVDLLLLATSTPDRLLPPTAPAIAAALGLRCGAIDLAGACAGFLTAFIMAESHRRVTSRSVLVVASNVMSRRLRRDDPATAPIFADGAGAVLITPDAPPVLGYHLGSDGAHDSLVEVPAGGSRQPVDAAAIEANDHCMTLRRGPELFRHAVRAMVRSANAALDNAGLSTDDVDFWVPHQANQRITESIAEQLGLDLDRCAQTIDRYGNSSAATIPIALDEAARNGRLERGQRVLLTAAGAGIVEAAVVLQW